MRVNIYLIFFATCLLSACYTSKDLSFDPVLETQLIKTVLLEQQNAWNTGDINQFMEGYWKNKNLSFIGKKGVTRGWEATLANYKKGYPDQATMGKLHFDILETKILAKDAAYMIGKYKLTRKEDTPSGYFNLLWQKIDGQWKVVSDHTSG